MIGEAVFLPLLLASFSISDQGSEQSQTGYFASVWISVLLAFALSTRLVYEQLMGNISGRMINYIFSCKRGGLPKILIIGFCMSLELLLLAYSSNPARVPGVYQPVLLQTIIVWNVILSKIVMDVNYTPAQMVGLALIVLGIGICLVPTAIDIANPKQNSKMVNGEYWLLIFLLGTIASGVASVGCELAFEQYPVLNVDLVLTFAAIAQVISIGLLIWMDFVPGLGESRNVTDFVDEFTRGLTCVFIPGNAANPRRCRMSLPLSFGFVISHMFMYVFGYKLVRWASANYFATLQTLANCTSCFFWILLPNVNRWAGGEAYDSFDILFALAALVPMLIGITIFRSFEKGTERHIVLGRESAWARA